VLQEAQGQPAKLALATVDITYPELPNTKRAALKAALEAAAIPHWCDEGVLAALLEIRMEESAARIANLRALSVVEPFRARGGNAINVHEASRLAIRKRLAADEQARFRALSGRATAYFGQDSTHAGRVEWIYHLLCSDSERGANELEKLDSEWSRTAHAEERYALAAALRELENSQVLQGRARVWALLVAAWNRVSRGESAQLAVRADHILSVARLVDDLGAEAEALALLGDALEAQGKLKQAQAAFGQYLSIRRRLAEKEPTNPACQLDLAVAHMRVGGVFEAQGKLDEAQAAFETALAIDQGLAEQEPTNAGWRRDLAVAYNRVGGVFELQGKLIQARTAFGTSLAINKGLAEQDPTNGPWQRELAVAYTRLGGVFTVEGKLSEAEAAYAAALGIISGLAEQDPSRAGWQRDLAVGHNRMGLVFTAQGKLTEAEAAYAAALAIVNGLAEQDPSNAGWQRDLAVVHDRMGVVFQGQGKLNEAQAAFEAALAINERLAAQDQSDAECQRSLALSQNRMGALLEEQGKLNEARAAFEAALVANALGGAKPKQYGRPAGFSHHVQPGESCVRGVRQAEGGSGSLCGG
jgi:tetratricopeptide (TPR) repeat protein